MSETAIQESTPKHIFLTGADTTLGLAVTQVLVEAGHTVTGLVEGTPGSNMLRAVGGLPAYADTTRSSELASVLKLANADMVVNLAPQTYNEVPMINAKVDGEAVRVQTEALIVATQAAGIGYFVQGSLAAVYGEQGDDAVTEETAPQPGEIAFLQGVQAAEQAVIDSDLTTCVLRFGFLYGAESEAFTALAAALRAARPIATGEGIANWLYLGDAVEAVRRVVEGQPANVVFNVVDGTPRSSDEFVDVLANQIGVKSGMIPNFVSRLLGNRQQVAMMDQSARVSHAAITEALGWEPRYPDSADGISQVLMSWRAAASPVETLPDPMPESEIPALAGGEAQEKAVEVAE